MIPEFLKSPEIEMSIISDTKEFLRRHGITHMVDQERLLDAFLNKNLEIVDNDAQGRKVAKVRASRRNYVGIIVGKSGKFLF